MFLHWQPAACGLDMMHVYMPLAAEAAQPHPPPLGMCRPGDEAYQGKATKNNTQCYCLFWESANCKSEAPPQATADTSN